MSLSLQRSHFLVLAPLLAMACSSPGGDETGATSSALSPLAIDGGIDGATLIGAWALNDGTGQVVHDSSASPHDATLGHDATAEAADPTWSADGPSLLFNGSQIASVPASLAIQPAYVTVEAWVKGSGAQPTNHYIVSKQYVGCTRGQYALFTGLTTGGIAFYVYNGSGIEVSPEATPDKIWDGKWHHSAGVYDGTAVHLYIDGVEYGKATVAGAGGPIVYDPGSPGGPSPDGLFFGDGGSTCNLGFNGQIHDVRLYSGAAQPAQVNGDMGLSPPALIYPKYNEVFQKNIHNAYWLNVFKSPDDPYAAGPQMQIWDMIMHEHARSLEWDLHDLMDNHYLGTGKHPGEFGIYHTNEPVNSQCWTLADCLQLLQRLDYVLPQHEVVHIALEFKELDKLLTDTSLFDDGNWKPEDLDRQLWEHLGPRIYTPAEFMSRCDGDVSLRACATAKGWPTIDELRGRYIFTVHGTEQTGYPGESNERAFTRYANVDIRSRAAFPMFVVHDDLTLDQKPAERDQHFPGTAPEWQNILGNNTIFFDIENAYNPQFIPTDGSAIDKTMHAIVRPAAAHEVDWPIHACPNCKEDDVGTYDQDWVVQHGWQLLMTDYPANYISDIQKDDPNPLKLPTRVSRPFSVANDVDLHGAPPYTTTATVPRAGVNLPQWGEPQLVEPGSRIYFDTANRITNYDMFTAVDDTQQSDPKHLGYAQALRKATPTEGTEDWEVFPATSMSSHSQGPLETTPYGQGCFVASSVASGAPDDPTASGATASDYIKVCRNPTNDDQRTVNMVITTRLGGALQTATVSTGNIKQGSPYGESIRVRLARNGAGTVVDVFTASEHTPDGSPLWNAWKTFTFASSLIYQGLSQKNDGVFTGTRLNGQPMPLAAFDAGVLGNYAYDLSFCVDGSCRSPSLPSHETFFTSPAGAQFVGVHETEGPVFDGQWRTLYTTDKYEVFTSGLGQYPVSDKFVLRRTAPTDSSWTALFRCVDWTRDVHTYWLDTDPTCPNDKGPAARSGGVMGFIATTPLPNTQPLYHMRKGTQNATNVNTHDHYFALGFAEAQVKAASGYDVVKVVGYVFTPSSLVAPVCTPKSTCEAGTCGSQPDGCGGTFTCPSNACTGGTYCYLDKCIAPGTNCTADCNEQYDCEIFVGNSVEYASCRQNLSQCLTSCSCVKKTCASQGLSCGSASDGCGGTLSCGTCTAANNVCTAGACVCQKQTSCTGKCGVVSDGCGGTFKCPSCSCTPSCDNKVCGASDGCGGSCVGTCGKSGFICDEDPTTHKNRCVHD